MGADDRRVDDADGGVFRREEIYRRTRGPVDRATTLIRDAYVSSEFFELERERVFGSGWVAVGCAASLREPGDVIVADVAGRSVLILMDRHGELRGFYNACRHRGTELLEAHERHVDGRFIRCPYHGWAYDLSGRCVGTPMFAGSEIPPDQHAVFDTSHVHGFDKRDYGLLGVAVARFGPVVLVNLDPQPAPLHHHLGDLVQRLGGYPLDDLALVRTGEYEIAANHKLIAENFMECYHLPWVHPGLVQVSPVEAHRLWQGEGMYTGMSTSPIAPDTDQGGWQGLAPFPGLDHEDSVSARFVWLFPNIALNVLPNHVFLILAQPRGAGATRETTYLLASPESAGDPAAEAAIDALAAFWDTVNREDIAIVQRVQRGLGHAPFPGGPMCYRFEESVHRFQNMIADRMVGVDRARDRHERDGGPALG